MPSSTATWRDLIKPTSLHFFLMLPAFIILLFVILLIFFQVERRADRIELEGRLSRAVAFQRLSIFEGINVCYSELLFLARQNELARYLDSNDEAFARSVESEYRKLMICRGVYDQIRLLDMAGQEKIRVNYNGGTPSAVKRDALQDKSSRYYYTEAIGLDEGQIYLSPLDLNMENGVVERPLKPMLRLATPVFDSAGNKSGLLILNFLANHLLERLTDHGTVLTGDTYLVNADGYWLMNPNPDDAWGFMFTDKSDRRFSLRNPDVWEEMISREDGAVRTMAGVFEFTHVHPLANCTHQLFNCDVGTVSENLNYFWILVHFIPNAVGNDHVAQLIKKNLLLGVTMVVVLIPGIWALSYEWARRKMRHVRIKEMAMHDELTGLYNRRAFTEQLRIAIHQGHRYRRRLGFLYVDLDGFKAVNDTYGHQAGDEVLMAVARRIQYVTRESDVVARLGGDEFACILTEINVLKDAEVVAQKIIETMQKPITFQNGTATCNASVGISVYPDHATEGDALFREADRAMYQAKHCGKNRCVMAHMPAGGSGSLKSTH